MHLSKTLLSILVFAISSFSTAKVFEATGSGETADIARKNAVTNAIKYSVGEFVVSKQELNNDELTENTINYSNAYVKSTKVISENVINGEYEVKVEVDIESQKLLEVIKESQTAHISVDKKKLLKSIDIAKKTSADNGSNDFERLVNELVVNPAIEKKELLSIKVAGELDALDGENLQGFIQFKLPIEVIPSKSYVKGVRKIVNEMKIQPKPVRGCYRSDYPLKFITQYTTEYRLESSASEPYCIDEEKGKIFEKLFYTASQEFPKSLHIDFIDQDDEVIKSNKTAYMRSDSNCDDLNSCFRFKTTDDKNVYIEIKALTPQYNNTMFLYTNENIKLDLYFFLTRNEVEKLKDIKLYFSNSW